MDKLLHGANFFVFFVWHPERAWAIAAVFFAGFLVSLFVGRTWTTRQRSIHSWMLLVPAMGWTLFGLLEAWCMTKKGNIRIDLLVTWPAILGITAVCLAWWSASLIRRLARPR